MSLVRVRQPARRYDPFARARRLALVEPSGAIPKNAKGASTEDHLIPKTFIEVPRDIQVLGVTVGRKIVSCEESGCLWFLLGHEGESDGKPFRHPQGVNCGDFDACPDPNCPCPDNLVYGMKDGVVLNARNVGADREVKGHLVQDVERGPAWRANVGGRGLYETTQSEVIDRLHDGTDAVVALQDMIANGAGEYRALP